MKSKTIQRVNDAIAKMLHVGKRRIYFAELISKCEISPTYARELLRSYAIANGFTYDKGYLFVE